MQNSSSTGKRCHDQATEAITVTTSSTTTQTMDYDSGSRDFGNSSNTSIPKDADKVDGIDSDKNDISKSPGGEVPSAAGQ